MYIISLNIIYKDGRKIILTESPYLFVNQELKPIITEIRKLIKDDLSSIAEQMKLPIRKLSLGMTTFSFTENVMHFFEVDAINVRELKFTLLEH